MASEQAKDLLAKMLVWNPDKRPTAQVCLNHPFF
jgi:serine/threonine protein kinase